MTCFVFVCFLKSVEATRNMDWKTLKKIVKKWHVDDDFLKTVFDERETQIATGHEDYSQQNSVKECEKTTDIALATREPEPVVPDYNADDDLIKSIKLKKKSGSEEDESRMEKLRAKIAENRLRSHGLQRAALVSALSKRRKLRNMKLKGLCPETYDKISHAYADESSSSENDDDNDDDDDLDMINPMSMVAFKKGLPNTTDGETQTETETETESETETENEDDEDENENESENDNIGNSNNTKKTSISNYTSGIRKRCSKKVIDRTHIKNGKLLSEAAVKHETDSHRSMRQDDLW